MCHEEARLNRRLAPEIYLGVVGIAYSEGRYSLTSEEDPAAIEYAVEMRRVAEDRNLALLATGGDFEPHRSRPSLAASPASTPRRPPSGSSAAGWTSSSRPWRRT